LLRFARNDGKVVKVLLTVWIPGQARNDGKEKKGMAEREKERKWRQFGCAGVNK